MEVCLHPMFHILFSFFWCAWKWDFCFLLWNLHSQALPIFLDALVPAWGAILISVTLILTFGEVRPTPGRSLFPRLSSSLRGASLLHWSRRKIEGEASVLLFPDDWIYFQIIPQAVCSRYGLSVGAKLSRVVRILLLLFFPIAYPISKVIHSFRNPVMFLLLFSKR